MLRYTLLVALACCMMLLPGCSDSRVSEVAGTYVIDKEATRAELQKRIDAIESEEARFGAQLMLSMVESFQWTLTLNEDMTATGTSTFAGQTSSVSGSWSLDGDTITLTIAEEGQAPEVARGTIRDSVLVLNPPEGNNMDFNLTFRKQEDEG